MAILAPLTALVLTVAVVIDHRQATWFGLFFIPLTLAIILGLLFKVGNAMFRQVTTKTVADFAFTWSILIAVTFYHSLSQRLPKVVIDYFGNNPFFYPFRDQPAHPANPSYRAILAYIACYLFYKLIKAYLMQVLELDPGAPKNPPRTGPSSPDSSLPDKPFVPFDPYDLSKNRPLHPL